jgi:copper homeostasis protein
MEVCVDSVQSALNAAEGGATRIELCANLMEGGTTPTTGMLKVIKSVVTVPVFVMVRPRGGDFLYDEHEFKVMKEDMKALEAAGADGIVFGILCKDGSVDQHRCQEVLGLTQLPVTFHRAFDMVNDPVQALEEIIGLGFKRVLTSGQETSAMDGAPLIAQLIEQVYLIHFSSSLVCSYIVSILQGKEENNCCSRFCFYNYAFNKYTNVTVNM